jgi:uncharacterized protein HemX
MKLSKVILAGLFMVISLKTAAQSPVERGFETAPDTVYGVLVGFIAIAVTALFGTLVWAFRKVINFAIGYKEKREESGAIQLQTLQEISLGITNLTKEVSGQGAKIQEIETNVDAIRKNIGSIEDKVLIIEQDLTALKGQSGSIQS